jgi:glucose uptake protein GlcU
MTIALVLFAVAALGGLTMAVMRFRGAERPPTGLALLHGALAAAGLIALIVAMTETGVPALARTALVFFIVAALGGFYLFAQHMQKKALPIPIMVVHALVAVIGFVILLVVVTHAA